MFLLVPAYPGCPGSKAVKWSLLLLLLSDTYSLVMFVKCIGKKQMASAVPGRSSSRDQIKISI